MDVSIPYRFNESVLLLLSFSPSFSFQFLIGSMKGGNDGLDKKCGKCFNSL